MNWIVSAIVALCVYLFTMYGFFWPQECDIDKIYLWCNLHPMSGFDYIGCIMFYAAAGFLALNPVFEKLNIMNPEGSAPYNVALFLIGAIGVGFIWI